MDFKNTPEFKRLVQAVKANPEDLEKLQSLSGLNEEDTEYVKHSKKGPELTTKTNYIISKLKSIGVGAATLAAYTALVQSMKGEPHDIAEMIAYALGGAVVGSIYSKTKKYPAGTKDKLQKDFEYRKFMKSAKDSRDNIKEVKRMQQLAGILNEATA